MENVAHSNLAALIAGRRARPMVPLGTRLAAKTLPPNESGCRIFVGAKHPFGYGQIGLGRRGDGIEQAHRVAWTLANGPVPAGLCVCHTCDVPACVEVSHLFLGTKADNNRDMCAKGRHWQMRRVG